MTLIDEAVSATRGVFALAGGQKDSEKYFDNSDYGLIGAIIALILSIAINAHMPIIAGHAQQQLLGPREATIFISTIYLIQIGVAAIVLNQFNLIERLRAYLIADFWSNFIIIILMAIPALFRVQSLLFVLILAIGTIIIKINIMRLIIKLNIGQIIIFFVAQLTAGFVGLIILGSIFGVNIAE